MLHRVWGKGCGPRGHLSVRAWCRVVLKAYLFKNGLLDMHVKYANIHKYEYALL